MTLNVVVVGGGIAGLSAAIALLQAGHKVKIFEKSAFAAEVGAAVAVAPNGARVLAKLGFSFAAARADELDVWETVNGITMEKLAAVDQRQNRVKWGYPMMSIHRVDLHNELLRLLRESGPPDTLQLSSPVAHVDAVGGSVTLESGKSYAADLIVSADGLHSVSRRLLVTEKPPRHTGLSAFRFLLPTSTLEADPVASPALKEKVNGATILADVQSTQERHMVWYTCRNHEIQNLAGIHHSRGDKPAGVDDATWYRQELAEEFGNFHPSIRNLLPLAEAVKCWPLSQAEPLSKWVHGKVVLIGDSAHPMLPLGGQGANQAMEDAGALGFMLRDASPANMKNRLELFELVRVKRAARTQTLSSVRAGSEKQVEPKLKPWAEPAGSAVPTTFQERVDHDYGFDVFARCKEVLLQSVLSEQQTPEITSTL